MFPRASQQLSSDVQLDTILKIVKILPVRLVRPCLLSGASLLLTSSLPPLLFSGSLFGVRLIVVTSRGAAREKEMIGRPGRVLIYAVQRRGKSEVR